MRCASMRICSICWRSDSVSRSSFNASLARRTSLYSALWPIVRPRSLALSSIIELSLHVRRLPADGEDIALASGEIEVDADIAIPAVARHRFGDQRRSPRVHLECEQPSTNEYVSRIAHELGREVKPLSSAEE